MNAYQRFILFGLLLLAFCSCKNYYNDSLKWIDSIPIGTPIDTVKKQQPGFLEIEWDAPIKIEDESMCCITKIKGNHWDILNMSHCLIFKNGAFAGRISIK